MNSRTDSRRRSRWTRPVLAATFLFLMSLAVQVLAVAASAAGAEPPRNWVYRLPDQTPGQYPGHATHPGFGYGYPGWPPGPGLRHMPPPGMMPPPRPQAPARTERSPRIELEVTEGRPYQLENLLVRVRVVSDANLATANPDAPATDDALWQRLAGPMTYPRVSQGRSEIVNEYAYILRPLRAGNLEVPPIAVSGRELGVHGQDGRHYEVISQPIHLRVQPAEPGVTPWLPLQGLTLKADLDERDPVEPGRPLRLELQLEAIGAPGDQLPSLEAQLRASDLRLYRERTSTVAHVSSDGRRLIGRRTEYYTLIPEAGRRLRLPELRVAWWNTETGGREVAALPIQTLGPAGASGFNLSRPSADWRVWDPLWLPLVVLTLLLIGYWVGVWWLSVASSPRRHTRSAPSPFAVARAFVHDRSRALIPHRQARRFLDRLVRALPPATRLRRRIRFANRATTPADWLTRFQQLASHDRVALSEPVGRLTDHVLRLYPAAKRERIEILERQLDGAIYAGQELDFLRWKGQLGREISLASQLWQSYRVSWLQRPELPPLNPG